MALACVDQLIGLVPNRVLARTGVTGLVARLTGEGEGVTGGTRGSSDDRLRQEVGGEHDGAWGRGAGWSGDRGQTPQEM